MHFIYGNGELAVLAQLAATDPTAVTYWGTTSGEPPQEPLREILRWTGTQLADEDVAALEAWRKTVRLEVTGLGGGLFCHGTPRDVSFL